MVARIEKIEGGVVVQRAEPDPTGRYHCLPEGQTMSKYAVYFSSLDDAADFLIANKRGRIRMNPGWSLIVDHIFIDGTARELL